MLYELIKESLEIAIIMKSIKELEKSEKLYIEASKLDLAEECKVERESLEKLIGKAESVEKLKSYIESQYGKIQMKHLKMRV